jgi:hypothetical protein
MGVFMMPVTSFNMDAKFDAMLEMLKKHYGATSKAEIIRKAVNLLRIAKENEDEDGSFILKNSNEEIKIIVK